MASSEKQIILYISKLLVISEKLSVHMWFSILVRKQFAFKERKKETLNGNLPILLCLNITIHVDILERL